MPLNGIFPPGYFPLGFFGSSPDVVWGEGVGANDVGGDTPPVPFDVDLQTYLVTRLSSTVYAGHIPETAPLPAYSYFLLDEDPNYTVMGAGCGLATVIYQIDIWAADYLTASTMQLELRNALHGFRGYMGSTLVSSCRLLTRHTQAEPNVSGGDDWIHHGVCEYRILYQEGIPTF